MNNLILPKPKNSTRRRLAGVLGLLLALGLLVVLALPASILAFPGIPEAFSGTVDVNDSPAVVGTLVQAKIGGTVFGQQTLVSAGQYSLMVVQSDDVDTLVKEGGVNGDTVDFFVTPPGPNCPQTYAASATYKSAGPLGNGTPATLNLSVSGVVCGYTLTYTAGAGGTISGSSPQAVAPGGNGSAVTAVANAGYHFVNWSDSSTANPRTDTNVQANISVTANFAINQYTLTYTAGANGTISGTSPQTVNYGANGTAVTAVANAGYHFVNWSGGSTANPRQDTNVQANVSVTANFAINTYTLTYTAGANGTISGTSPQTVNYGGNGTAVTAVADAGYHFVDWSDASTANPRTDTNVQADKSVTANFEANPINPGLPGAVKSMTLNAGWNTFSIPIKPETTMDTWGEFIDINTLDVEVVYGYDAVDQLWIQMQAGDEVVALDGYYIKMIAAGTAWVVPSAIQSAQPVKALSAGLNLVGVASLVDVDVDDLLITVYPDYSLVHNPPVNGAGNWVNNIFIRGDSPVPTAKVGLAYWVTMQNPGNMVGFTSTPLP